jgi:DNA-binding response OmpR family regulator
MSVETVAITHTFLTNHFLLCGIPMTTDEPTVLIAEDEESLRRLYTTWLDIEGYNVRTAENGTEAIELWDEEVDAVLLDRRMPEQYGDDVLETAREDDFDTPVSMITAVDPDLDISQMEFDDYIVKPTEREEVLDTISELVSTSDIRSTVREFARTGVKIQKLQKKHPRSMLKTHAEYNKLQREYKELQEEVKDMADELNEYEKQLLVEARQRAT